MGLRKLLLISSAIIFIVFSCGVEKTDKGTGTPDSTPPAQITDLAANNFTDSTLVLTWTAPGDDDTSGTAKQYDIRFDFAMLTDSTWDSAIQPFSLPIPQAAGTPETLLVFGLAADTTYYFGIKTADEVPNWSGISNIATGRTDTGLTIPDFIPPAAITDLRVTDAGFTFIELSWTVPGDDSTVGIATAYDIRYSTTEITTQNFAGVDQVPDPPTPLPPDSVQSYTFFDLDTNTTYYFAIKTADEVPNWSAMSNAAIGATSADTIPPAPISDLRVVDTTETTVTLIWTAPGDDDTQGLASFYDIRYSTASITELNFVDAQRASIIPTTSPSGSEDTVIISGLESGTGYYFAMKTADEAMNWSELSNVVLGRTIYQSGGDHTPPSPIVDLHVVLERTDQINLCWTAPGDDGVEGKVSYYDIRYALWLIEEENFALAHQTNDEPYSIVAGGGYQCDDVNDLDSGKIYYFAVKAADERYNWSEMSNVVMGYTGDTLPPAAITNLQITEHGSRWVELYWSAPGDDSISGRAKKYDIRYSQYPITDSTFDDDVQVADPPYPVNAPDGQSFVVEGLEPLTTYYFAIKAMDEMYYWSGLSNVVSVTTPEGCPPATITDLRVTESTLSSLTVAWTATGDDSTSGTATTTDLRYSAAMITEENFTRAFLAQDMPSPSPAGSIETYTLTDLNANTGYYLAMASVDDVPNWSEISNIAYGFTREDVDTISPSPVTTLRTITMRSSSVVLNWLAPGNDGSEGQASVYEIRFALQPITSESWHSAVLVENVPAPQIIGSLEWFAIEGLLPSMTYYVAIRSADTSGNWSMLSNVIEVLTSRGPDTWHTLVGGDYNDVAYSVAPTINGGCAVVGEMGLPGESQYPLHPSAGYFIYVDAEGHILWERKPREGGLPALSAVRSVIPAPDGGFIALGEFNTWSSPNIIVSDVYLMNFDEYGNFPWINTLSSISDWSQYADVVFPTQDGNVVTIWQYGSNYATLLKADYGGQTIWKKAQSASAFQYGGCYDICNTVNDGYIVVGGKYSFPHTGFVDLDTYIFETDSYGRFIRESTFGGPADDVARGVVGLPDSKYLIAGWTKSFGQGAKDVHLIWIDSSGNTLNEMFLGGNADDAAYAITPTSDGNFVIAGSTASYGAGNMDIYLIKINQSGTIIWEKTIGGVLADGAFDIVEASDGGLIIAGWTSSYGAGSRRGDVYIVKTDANGEL